MWIYFYSLYYRVVISAILNYGLTKLHIKLAFPIESLLLLIKFKIYWDNINIFKCIFWEIRRKK